MMRLLSVALRPEKVADWSTYPFVIPAIRTLETLQIRSRICFFVGENGSGKSTLLEAIAESYGFGPEGGSRSFYRETTERVRSVSSLSRRCGLRSVSGAGGAIICGRKVFFNIATEVDRFGAADGYGDISLHERSHGESFLALLQNRFGRAGFYILDEPEAALSPQRQLTMLSVLRELLDQNDEIQFLIATHSPILLAYPDAQILSFDDGAIHETTWQETAAYQVVARFLSRPEVYLREIFGD
jgi:predicted ATPase